MSRLRKSVCAHLRNQELTIDARVVESWLVGLPSTARDYARARIMALNDTNSMFRLVS